MAIHATVLELRARLLHFYGAARGVEEYKLTEKQARKLLSIERYEDWETAVHSVKGVSVAFVGKFLVTRLAKPSVSKCDVEDVFAYWKLATGKKPIVTLTAERRKRVRDRLKDGYTVETIKLAIDYIAQSPWHRGQNDRSTEYNDLELICRNATKLEKYAEKGERLAQAALPTETTIPERYQHLEDDDGELEL